MPRVISNNAALWAVTLALLGACSSSAPEYSDAPRSQNDICAIFEQRPGWLDAVTASEVKWGAPISVQMAIMWRESSFRAEARPLRKTTNALGFTSTERISSAYGFAQAINSTWDWYQDETGNSGADRTDFDDAADFVGWYMAKARRSNGIAMADAYNQYLAYHEGHAGHRRGTYNKKPWLLTVADKVQDRADLYRSQLGGCD